MPFFETETSANWCVESCSTQGTGDLVLIGASPGYVRFNQGMNIGDYVWYSITDGNNREAGVGLLQLDLIQRVNVTATLVNNVYTEGEGLAPISLSGSSVVASTLNAASLNELWDHIWNEANPHDTGFLDLSDSPASYSGFGGQFVAVKPGEDGLEFQPVGSGGLVAWGDISGVLSNQTDLQAALDAKEDGLGNPAQNGYVLSSTTGGVRSWVDAGGAGGPYLPLTGGTLSPTFPTDIILTLKSAPGQTGQLLRLETDTGDPRFRVNQQGRVIATEGGCYFGIDPAYIPAGGFAFLFEIDAGSSVTSGLYITNGLDNVVPLTAQGSPSQVANLFEVKNSAGAILNGFDSAGNLINGTGEANTTSNQGPGEGLALAKSGLDLPFKTLVAGSNITLTPGADTLTIASTAGGGASLFTDLGDTPSSYAGQTGKFVTVNGAEDGLEFSNAPAGGQQVTIDVDGTTPAQANGANSAAIGNNAISDAAALDGIAIGTDANCQQQKSIALGVSSTVSATDAVAIGSGSAATGVGGISIGAASTAATDSVVIGYNADSTAANAIIIGGGIQNTIANRINIASDSNNGLNIQNGQFSLVGSTAVYVVPGYATGSLPPAPPPFSMAYDSTTDELKIFDSGWSPVSVGEANIGQNLSGAGAEVYAGKNGPVLQFRELLAVSSRISVTEAGNNIQFDVAEGNIEHQSLNGAGVNTHAQIDTHIGSASNPHNVTAAQTGAEPDLGNPTTNGYVLSSTVGGVRSWVPNAGGGGASTFLELTDTPASYAGQAGLVVTVNPGEDGLTFTAGGGGGGENNTSSNQGGGIELALPKVGADLPFRTLLAGSTKSSITQQAQTVTIDVVEANIIHQSLSGAGTNTHAQIDNHIVATDNPHNTSYNDLLGVPATFPPSAHTHVEAEITDLDKYTQAQVDALIADTVIQNPAAGQRQTITIADFSQDVPALELAGGAAGQVANLLEAGATVLNGPGMLRVTSPTATSQPVRIDGAAGQTTDLLRFRDDLANTIARVAANGEMFVGDGQLLKSDETPVAGADKVTNIMSLTQAEYDAIGAPDAATLYLITG